MVNIFRHVMVEQILLFYLEVQQNSLGVQTSFLIWWIFHLVYLLNIYFVSNIFIFIDSSNNFLELGSIQISTHRNAQTQALDQPRFFKNRVQNRTTIIRNEVTLELEEI